MKKHFLWIVLGIVTVVISGYFIFSVKSIEVEVVAHDWKREIRIHDFQSRQYSGWDETVPMDAYDLTCNRQQRGTRRQYTGQTCIGSGEDRRCTNNYITVPAYDDYCSYTADRWEYLRSITALGNLREDTPYWLPLDFAPCVQIGCQREETRVESYRVFLRSEDGSIYHCNYDQDTWAGIRVGEVYTLVTRKFYAMPFCDSLQEKIN